MPYFIGVHKFPQALSDEEIEGKWAKYKRSCALMGLRPVRLHYNGAKASAFCETEAGNDEDVKKAHEAAGLTVDEVIEIKTAEQDSGQNRVEK